MAENLSPTPEEMGVKIEADFVSNPKKAVDAGLLGERDGALQSLDGYQVFAKNSKNREFVQETISRQLEENLRVSKQKINENYIDRGLKQLDEQVVDQDLDDEKKISVLSDADIFNQLIEDRKKVNEFLQKESLGDKEKRLLTEITNRIDEIQDKLEKEKSKRARYLDGIRKKVKQAMGLKDEDLSGISVEQAKELANRYHEFVKNKKDSVGDTSSENLADLSIFEATKLNDFMLKTVKELREKVKNVNGNYQKENFERESEAEIKKEKGAGDEKKEPVTEIKKKKLDLKEEIIETAPSNLKGYLQDFLKAGLAGFMTSVPIVPSRVGDSDSGLAGKKALEVLIVEQESKFKENFQKYFLKQGKNSEESKLLAEKKYKEYADLIFYGSGNFISQVRNEIFDNSKSINFVTLTANVENIVHASGEVGAMEEIADFNASELMFGKNFNLRRYNEKYLTYRDENGAIKMGIVAKVVSAVYNELCFSGVGGTKSDAKQAGKVLEMVAKEDYATKQRESMQRKYGRNFAAGENLLAYDGTDLGFSVFGELSIYPEEVKKTIVLLAQLVICRDNLARNADNVVRMKKPAAPTVSGANEKSSSKASKYNMVDVFYDMGAGGKTGPHVWLACLTRFLTPFDKKSDKDGRIDDYESLIQAGKAYAEGMHPAWKNQQLWDEISYEQRTPNEDAYQLSSFFNSNQDAKDGGVGAPTEAFFKDLDDSCFDITNVVLDSKFLSNSGATRKKIESMSTAHSKIYGSLGGRGFIRELEPTEAERRMSLEERERSLRRREHAFFSSSSKLNPYNNPVAEKNYYIYRRLIAFTKFSIARSLTSIVMEPPRPNKWVDRKKATELVVLDYKSKYDEMEDAILSAIDDKAAKSSRELSGELRSFVERYRKIFFNATPIDYSSEEYLVDQLDVIIKTALARPLFYKNALGVNDSEPMGIVANPHYRELLERALERKNLFYKKAILDQIQQEAGLKESLAASKEIASPFN